MKLLPSRPYRRLLFTSLFALAFGSGLFDSLIVPVRAQATNPPPKPAPPVPTGLADQPLDKETGKPLIRTASGLQYAELTVGTGPAIKVGDKIAVNYVGKLLDGTVFDASAKHGGPFTYVQGVDSLIAGWTEGVSTMHVGGKRKLIIPSNLGYGQQGAGDTIPPNSTLIFEIEVVSVQ